MLNNDKIVKIRPNIFRKLETTIFSRLKHTKELVDRLFCSITVWTQSIFPRNDDFVQLLHKQQCEAINSQCQQNDCQDQEINSMEDIEDFPVGSSSIRRR